MPDLYYVTAPSGWRCIRVEAYEQQLLSVILLNKDGSDFAGFAGYPRTTIDTIDKLRSFIENEMPGFGLVKPDPEEPWPAVDDYYGRKNSQI